MHTASTAPMDFWQDKFWHHRVHQRLGETLHYYLIRVRPFDYEQITHALRTLLTEKHLGSVRVFPIFGSYDLIIRAWLHSSKSPSFRGWLDANLTRAGINRAIHEFSVDSIDKRWHDHTDINREHLENLDEDTIRAVQSGQHEPSLVRELLDCKLVLVRRPTNNINFFTTIILDQGNESILDGLLNGVRHYLQDNPGIEHVSMYRGFGFCSALIKDQVQDYFNIAPLTNWIGGTYKSFTAHTETYLVHGPVHIMGDEKIGEATFHALQGRDLYVQSIIPELYDPPSTKKHEVQRILLEEAHKQPLTKKDKKLLHDYLLGYLNDAPTEMAKALFTLFYELEFYLRSNLNEFIGRKSKQPIKAIFDKLNLPETDWDRPTLRPILAAYSLTIKLYEQTGENTSLIGSWDKLSALRNDIVHGNVDVLPNWSEFLRTLVPYLPRIRHLLGLIESVTDKQYSGVY